MADVPFSEHSFTVTRQHWPAQHWPAPGAEALGSRPTLEDVLQAVQDADSGVPPYLADLARLEDACQRVFRHPLTLDPAQRDYTLNPALEVLPVAWSGLCALLDSPADDAPAPRPTHELLLVYPHPVTRKVHCRPAEDGDLLALKVVAESIPPGEAAREAGVSRGCIRTLLRRTARRGLLLGPQSSIIRTTGPDLDPAVTGDRQFRTASTFTLQWHLTQACDLHCKHCYDRTPGTEMDLQQGLAVLDQLEAFCEARGVHGQVTFTGGNPLLYPHLDKLYASAAERGLTTAFLGNPAPRESIERLVALARPAFYQVSLEGLQEHTDHIRGTGHYRRTLAFLQTLRELKVRSMVMLTLTRDNRAEVLPLAEELRHSGTTVTFNRLASVGEGASLAEVPPGDFAPFLADYHAAARHNPAMTLKESLLNLTRREAGLPVFGGCTGFGCGAAFNFASVLPDGQVHACRKFPSPLGHIFTDGLAAIYDSALAARYRAGPQACAECELHLVCRGCLAVAGGRGLDVFAERDPYCFVAGVS